MTDTREHIIKTSLLLFLQKSYKEVTMKEIVENSGLSKGAFYHYFTSKEALFKEIAGLFFAMGAIDYSKLNQQSLKAFYTDYLDNTSSTILKMNEWFGLSEKHTISFNFFLIMFEAISRFPEFLDLEFQMHTKDVEAWKKVIATARKKKEIKSKSTDEEIAELFLYCNDGVFIRYMNTDKSSTYRDFLLPAFNTLYNGLKT
ncbi:MAG: TetR/AcrR family transcriptional regulator [Bacteroidetes bacterium HGW-Bacteroidetes-21]|nr:MAG: TetR/AcrR family transcriptional regulator [Bacteroidetes bacterium HGW-Bacteroidetes-21]